jgi:predicted GNAT family acetyltransferase
MACAVAAMPAVHENMHQWTGQQEQERRCAQEMGAVLTQQKIAGDATEYQQAEGVPGGPEWRRRGLTRLCIMDVVHLTLPWLSAFAARAATLAH